MNNRLKAFFQEDPAPLPSFPNKELTIMGLYNLIHEMETDRRELQEALEEQIAEVARLTQLLNGK